MRNRTLHEVVNLMAPVGAEIVGDSETVVGPDVVLDNRRATPGALFLAVPGERVDGHDYAPQAVAAGAAAVMGMYTTQADVPHILVPDTVQALPALARGVVKEAIAQGLVSIGITGSAGKTSTKDLLAQILEHVGPTVAPEGSQNNEIGVPLTALRVSDDTRFLISEMGARGVGHIAQLVDWVPLHVGAVLNVGRAHVGEFGDVATTARAKSEIIASLPASGWAVLNGDDPAVREMASRTNANIAWFGEGDLPESGMTVQIRNLELNSAAQPGFDVVQRRGDEERSAHVQLQLVGRANASNALAAATIALCLGVELETVATALNAAVRRSDWRMELTRLSNDVLVLNDAYNANPESMAAALHTASELGQFQRADFPEARVVAVLGDMLELGATSPEMHQTIGRLAADLRINEVIAVGTYATDIQTGASQEGTITRVMSGEDVAGALSLRPGDVVLIKGSRGVGLEVVAADLIAGDSATW